MVIKMVINKWEKIKSIKGFSLIELIVAIGIFAILASGVVYVFVTSYRNYYGVGDRQVMVQFAQEGMEAVRSIRDNGWQVIVAAADGTDRGVQQINGTWQFSGTSNTLNDFTRVIVVSDVERNSSGSIVASGGTDDPDTKKVVVTVSGTGVADYVLTTYLTNWSAKGWIQSDWSGVGASEFWASAIMASSSYSNVSTSTVGQLSLSAVGAVNGSFGAWADFASDTSYVPAGSWPTPTDLLVSPDGDTLYMTAVDVLLGVTAIDISNVRENKMNKKWNLGTDEGLYTMAIHPNGRYLYVGSSDCDEGARFIEVIDLYTISKVQEITTDRVATNLRVMDMVVNDAGTLLYAVSSFGGLYIYTISADGSTLTPTISGGGGQVISRSWTEWGYNWHNMWLDDSGATPYLYLTSEDYYYALTKWDVSNTSSATLLYRYQGSGDYNDIVYLGNTGSGNTFAVASEDATELYTFRDGGSSFTQLDSFDPGTFSSPGLIYDGQGSVIIYSTTEANLYEVNVSDPTNITGGISDTSTYASTCTTWPHHYAEYDSKKGGFYLIEYKSAGSPYFQTHWISRPETRPTPATFTYKRKITINSSQVNTGPHSSFPVLIDETQTYLKYTSFGGRLQNASAYDLIFTDSTQSTILDHEIESYSSSTGRLTAWVRIPTLSSDTDTDIYMFYGNSNVVSSLERVSSVWDSSYQVVNHMIDLSATTTRNSKFNSNDANKYVANGPLDSSGKISQGQTYDGSYDYQTITNHADNQQGTSDFTIEFWIKPDSSGTKYSSPVYKGNGDTATQEGWLVRYLQGVSDKLQFHAGTGSVNLGGMTTNSALTEDIWTHAAVTVDRDVGYRFYINGNSDASYNIDSSAYTLGTVRDMAFGRDWSSSDYFFKGILDEIRVSKTLRSAGWIKTGVNNMSATSTFYTIGSEANSTIYNTPGSIMSSIIDLGSSDKVLTSFVVNQNVPTGCALTVTLQGSNDPSFASYTSNVFTDNSTPIFTSSTPVSLNNLRYFRYSTALTACSDNSATPTLYSVKLNYR